MGLDMYAYRIAKGNIEDGKEVDFEIKPPTLKEGFGVEPQEIKYWRKHPNLHGWMNRLYENKGGKECFNCVNLKLTKSDLLKLKKDIKSNALPTTTGFFFGQSQEDEEKKTDLEFVDNALDAIACGDEVYYTSWW